MSSEEQHGAGILKASELQQVRQPTHLCKTAIYVEVAMRSVASRGENANLKQFSR
jgi:hypothetical protein